MSALTPSFTTPDLPRCLAFYRDELGFECPNDMRNEAGKIIWAELGRGAARLMLLAAEEPVDTGARYDAAGVIFYLEVDGLALLREALLRGGRAVSPIEATFYGMREVYLKDPDGRQLTLAEPCQPGDEVTVHGL